MFRCSSPSSRSVFKRRGGGKVSIQHNAEPDSAEILMKTIVSMNGRSVETAVLSWCLERRSGGNLNISHDPVTKPTRHETSDLFDHTSRNRPRTGHTNRSVEFQVLVTSLSRNSILEDCTSGTILCKPTSDKCRENSAMRDDPTAEEKGALGDDIIFGPIHHAKMTLHYGRCGVEVQIDPFGGDGKKSWVVISRGVDGYATEISAGCKQSMYPETVAPQDASSSTEQSVAGVAFATRSKAKAPHQRCAEPNSPPVKFTTAASHG